MDQALFLLLYLFAGDPVEIVDPAFYFKSIKQPYDTASLVKLFGKDVRDNSDLAKRLKELGDEDRKVRKNAKKRLLEIGNILINGCIGSLSNLMSIECDFSVPQLYNRNCEIAHEKLSANTPESFGLIITATLQAEGKTFTTDLFLTIKEDSVPFLLESMEKYIK